MNVRLPALAARLLLLLALLSAPAALAAKTRVLIITGGHAYDTTAFNAMWNSFTDVEWTVRPQAFGHEVFEDVSAWSHDVLVFYNHQNPGNRLQDKHKRNFLALLDKGVGMLVLHHAVAAYPMYPEFEALAGVKYRSATYYQDTLSTAKVGVPIPCAVSDASHPLAAGLPASFTLTDEMYFSMRFASDNRVFLTTSYPESQGPLAWTRKRGNSRVFTTLLGHGSTIFSNAPYRKMMEQAIAWIKPCAAGDARAVCAPVPVPPKRVLVFHKQNGFIHEDTDTCVALLVKHLAAQGLPAESTKDSLAFTPANLARFGALVFCNTNYRNGALLSRAQEEAVEGFVHGGGGFVGIHSAIPLNGALEESVWPWYARMFGARFKSHPAIQSAVMVVEDTGHPSTRGLPARITLRDEWYQVQTNPRTVAGLKVLASLDASSYPGGLVTGDHPVSWHRSFEGGRTWVTLVGHDLSAFANPDYMAHVRGGILWAGGWEGPTSISDGPVRRDKAARREIEGGMGPGTARMESAGRAAGWIYRGKGGERLEIRTVTGRFIDARRTGPGDPGAKAAGIPRASSP
jgi:type 1 glutamine amidotransferase